MLKKLRGGCLMGIGYMLSPLSWWNDLFFNMPIAYLFAYSFSWIFPDLFLPLTAVGYWLSNIIGILMMHRGATDMLFEQKQRDFKKDLLIGFGTSTVYTLVVLVKSGGFCCSVSSE
ncbi:hypothetical protein [Coleofasciculus sp. F4-SAH-05]|uniref:hypothetical protein n=1 Tax=Coleofasciculus sp. F4-SAH-05 TaxID=3069525 RepID=UPI003303B216